MKRAFLPSLVLVAVLALVGWRKDSEVRAGWEYREMRLSSSAGSEPLLNRMGAEGWELVGVVSACSPDCMYWAYMKRPK